MSNKIQQELKNTQSTNLTWNSTFHWNTKQELIHNLSIPKNPKDFSEYITTNKDQLKSILKEAIDNQTDIFNWISKQIFSQHLWFSEEHKDLFMNKLGVILWNDNNKQIINLSWNWWLISFKILEQSYYFINYYEQHSNLRLNDAQFEIFKNKYWIITTYKISYVWNVIFSKIELLILKWIWKDYILEKWYEYCHLNLATISTKENDIFEHLEKLQIITAYPQNIYNTNIIENLISFINEMYYYDDKSESKLPYINNSNITEYINTHLMALVDFIEKLIKSYWWWIDLDQLWMILQEKLIQDDYNQTNIPIINNIFDCFDEDDDFEYAGPISIDNQDKSDLNNYEDNYEIEKNQYFKINNMFGAFPTDSVFSIWAPQYEDLPQEEFEWNQDNYIIIWELIFSLLNKLSISAQSFICLDNKYELSTINWINENLYLLVENYWENNKYLLNQNAFEEFVNDKKISLIPNNQLAVEIVIWNLIKLLDIIKEEVALESYLLKIFAQKIWVDDYETISIEKIRKKMKFYFHQEISLESKFFIENLFKSINEFKDYIGINKIPSPDENEINNIYEFVYENIIVIQSKILKNISNKIVNNWQNFLINDDFSTNTSIDIIDKIIRSLAEIKIWSHKKPISISIFWNIKCLSIEILGTKIYFVKNISNKSILNSKDYNHFDIWTYKLIGNIDMLKKFTSNFEAPIIVNNYSDPIIEILNKYEILKKLDIDEYFLKLEIEKIVWKCNWDFLKYINENININFSEKIHNEIIGKLYIPTFIFDETFSFEESLNYILSIINSNYYNNFYKNGLLSMILEHLDYLINKYSIYKNSIN